MKLYNSIRQKGFTLIEVLVASLILFLVISTMTMIYRGAMLSSSKAERMLTFSTYRPIIREQINSDLNNSGIAASLQNNGVLGEVSYSWEAMPELSSKTVERLNASSGELESGVKTYVLWNVTLNMTLGKTTRVYEFQEMTW